MFFILSSGRCGSSTVATGLNRSPDCLCLHEPAPRLVRDIVDCAHGQGDARELVKLLRITRQPVKDGKVYGESSLIFGLVVPVLREAFPEARYIWLVRDGRDVAASCHAWGHYRPVEESLRLGMPHKAVEWARHRLRADLCGEMGPAEWEGLTRFEKCCWWWSKVNRLIESELARLPPERHLLVRLETLEAQGGGLWPFLGVRPPRRPDFSPRNASYDPVVGWDRWTQSERESFARLCGGVMDRLYPGWRDSGGNWRKVGFPGQESRNGRGWLRLPRAFRQRRRALFRERMLRLRDAFRTAPRLRSMLYGAGIAIRHPLLLPGEVWRRLSELD